MHVNQFDLKIVKIFFSTKAVSSFSVYDKRLYNRR